MEASEGILNWDVTFENGYTVVFFTIARTDGILEYELLSKIHLPPELQGKEGQGLIISGKGPVWLYAYLTHLAHPFAWVGIYEPRQQGAIVVERHTPASPSVGEVVPCQLPEASESAKIGDEKSETEVE